MALLGVEVIPDHIFNQMRSMVVEQLAALSDGSTIHCNGRLEAHLKLQGTQANMQVHCSVSFMKEFCQKCILLEPFANLSYRV